MGTFENATPANDNESIIAKPDSRKPVGGTKLLEDRHSIRAEWRAAMIALGRDEAQEKQNQEASNF
ncbi:hypothetical protein A3D88_03510 [Candidatus Peribacteria bacterium RIFCSPHIGHO2_02_FULL_52_16]|nr:MAG: hypothetical protein A2706_04325 [Candidatus Peribacteria bacterium RIFCSPHIGHO2_01_FULL_51_35]OGJ61752.1 MAG: hypothetical protein A3D88_03510 [Candidatus Peribacteria bacterium RIFCSPHIGHO2_02_FULL_52_16]